MKKIEVPIVFNPRQILSKIKDCYPSYFEPNNFSKDLTIICDFREPQKATDLLGLSFIITDLESLDPFRQLRLQVKEKYNLVNQEIKYSKFRASKRRPDYINSFLNVADEIKGLMVNFIIEPSLDELKPNYNLNFIKEYPSYETIKSEVFRKLNFVAHFIAVLILPLLNKDSLVHLISDQDDLFINPEIRDLSLAYIMNTMKAYSEEKEFILGYLDQEQDTEDRYLKDLSSIPDLAIGAITDLFKSFKGNYDEFRKGVQRFPDDVKEKAHSYSEWLFAKDKALRRTSFFVELTVEDEIRFYPLIPVHN